MKFIKDGITWTVKDLPNKWLLTAHTLIEGGEMHDSCEISKELCPDFEKLNAYLHSPDSIL